MRKIHLMLAAGTLVLASAVSTAPSPSASPLLVAQAAAQAGIGQPLAQALLEAGIDLAVHVPYTIDLEHADEEAPARMRTERSSSRARR